MNTLLKNIELISNLTEALTNWDQMLETLRYSPLLFSSDAWYFPKENTKLRHITKIGPKNVYHVNTFAA